MATILRNSDLSSDIYVAKDAKVFFMATTLWVHFYNDLNLSFSSLGNLWDSCEVIFSTINWFSVFNRIFVTGFARTANHSVQSYEKNRSNPLGFEPFKLLWAYSFHNFSQFSLGFYRRIHAIWLSLCTTRLSSKLFFYKKWTCVNYFNQFEICLIEVTLLSNVLCVL